MAPNAFTQLELVGIGVSPYATRGASQTLNPIAQATAQRRTVNGALVNLGFEGFKKYTSNISCTDMRAPICDGVWPGRLVTVKCIAELSYPVGGVAERTVVAGSSHTEQGITFYRPELAMMVVSFTMQRDEYGGSVGWSMALEEV